MYSRSRENDMSSVGNTLNKQSALGHHLKSHIRSLLAKPGSREIQILAALLTSLLLASGIYRLWPYLGITIPVTALWTTLLSIGLIKNRHWMRKNGRLWISFTIIIVGTIGVSVIIRPGVAGIFGDHLVGYYPKLGIIQVVPIYLCALFVINPKKSCHVLQTSGAQALNATKVFFRFTYSTLVRLAKAVPVKNIARSSIKTWTSLTIKPKDLLRNKFSPHSITRIGNVQEDSEPYLTQKASTPTSKLRPSASDHLDDEIFAIKSKNENNLLMLADAECSPSEISRLEGLSKEQESPVQSITALQTIDGWKIPSMDLLKVGKQSQIPEAENQAKAKLIETTLAEYGIEVTVEDIRPGPVVTQFGVVPGWIRKIKDVVETGIEGEVLRDEKGRLVKKRVEEKKRVKVDTILSRGKDLALALAARSLRFEAPVPGESFVGLEVPNDDPGTVTLRSLIESPSFESLHAKGYLPIAFGTGSGGETVISDLTDMPHLLIAGATGSGKSVCINTIICSLLMQFTPQDLRLLLIDPKRVELSAYQGLPHLLRPVLVEVDESPPALRGLIAEMQLRYKRFQSVRARNIQTYNQRITNSEERMPYIVLVIDELADLMMTSANEIEQSLCRLAQLGRATGIHLVIATQRPSVDVLTGLIKANFPSRISFVVSSHVDSRTILDGVGAETLLGRGDMLFLPTDYIKPKRMQGAYISDEEVQNISTHWGKQQSTSLPPVELSLTEEPGDFLEDEMLSRARDLAMQHNRISASLLQRKLGIGFVRASTLLDNLEEHGIVEPGDPGKSRAVTLGTISKDWSEG
ncbi:DNA translocase FtsK [SAR202 cluster bacterium AD-802-E10_MRT_200m]|nr:DNA translocase FtsK [SAR202 cluster bacterium AD-802-E10_MRT_200m]